MTNKTKEVKDVIDAGDELLRAMRRGGYRGHTVTTTPDDRGLIYTIRVTSRQATRAEREQAEAAIEMARESKEGAA